MLNMAARGSLLFLPVQAFEPPVFIVEGLVLMYQKNEAQKAGEAAMEVKGSKVLQRDLQFEHLACNYPEKWSG